MSLHPPTPASPLHPVIVRAAEGILPEWTKASPQRRSHMARVAAIMRDWARVRGEEAETISRWFAAGFLHDALRDEDHEVLRGRVDPSLRDLPGHILHGPGVAKRLQEEGVQDEELLHAICYHTLGSAGFGTIGMALYAADFLEPGRRVGEDWRAELRQRVPTALLEVVKEILTARIGYLLDKGRPLHPETMGFWNHLSEGKPWASASEF